MNLNEAIRAIFMAVILTLDLEYELKFKIQPTSENGIDSAIWEEVNSLTITIETDGNEIQCRFLVSENEQHQAVLQAGIGRPGIIQKDAVAKLTQDSYPEMAKEYAKTIFGFAISIATAV